MKKVEAPPLPGHIWMATGAFEVRREYVLMPRNETELNDLLHAYVYREAAPCVGDEQITRAAAEVHKLKGVPF